MICTQDRFEKDVHEHEMTIKRDDGVDRHIKFKKPGTSSYWFEILTWGGVLCIRGDMGTYVFSRLHDMFEFFRADGRGDRSKLYINAGYWCEKLQAVNSNGYGNGAAQKFSADRFCARVKDDFESYFENKEIEPTAREELWQEIKSDILDYVMDGDAGSAFSRLADFRSTNHPRLFEDYCDWGDSCDEYTFHFIWCLYAIAWSIRTYDAAKKTAEATVDAAVQS